MIQPIDLYTSTERELEIMIVDDDKIISLLHNAKLKKIFSHAISVHFNGRDALQHITDEKSAKKSFLVFLDLHMPVMNGWEFLEALNQLSIENEVYVIIVSSSVNSEERERAFKFPQVLDFSVKPFENKNIEKFPKLPELREYFKAAI